MNLKLIELLFHKQAKRMTEIKYPMDWGALELKEVVKDAAPSGLHVWFKVRGK